MSGVNLISRRLLGEGWTKEQIPPGMTAWADWNGGWTYSRDAVREMVFETPCGLLEPGYTFTTGYMAYGGIDWTVENNCPTVTCPYFGRRACGLVAEELKGAAHKMGHSGVIQPCALYRVDKAWDYEHSVKKVLDDEQRLEDELWAEYAAQRHGRTCRWQSRFDRTEQRWSTCYNWRECVTLGCSHCTILDRDMSPKRANVYYDLKCTYTEEGEGLFPDRDVVTITKGLKLLDKPVSETLCEIIVRRRDTVEDILFRKHTVRAMLFNIRYEVLNVRVERRESRDLLQDLADIKAGIAVIHASDQQKAARAKKSERREVTRRARVARAEKLVLERGIDALDGIERGRVKKLLSDDRIRELERLRRSAMEPEEQIGIAGF